MLFRSKDPSFLEWIPEFYLDGNTRRGPYPAGVSTPAWFSLFRRPWLSQCRLCNRGSPLCRMVIGCGSPMVKSPGVGVMVLHAALEPNVSDSLCHCSTLESIIPDLWVAMGWCAPWKSGSGNLFLTLSVTGSKSVVN